MRFELDRLRTEAQRLTGERPNAQVPLPDDLSKVGDWAHEAVPGRLVILPRAIRDTKKAQFSDIALVFRALLLLADESRDMKIEGGLQRKSAFDVRLNELGLRCEPTFAGAAHGEFGDTYLVTWRNQKRKLDMHMKNGGNTRDPTRCLRIYFFWDEDERQIVIGSLPSHLETRIT